MSDWIRRGGVRCGSSADRRQFRAVHGHRPFVARSRVGGQTAMRPRRKVAADDGLWHGEGSCSCLAGSVFPSNCSGFRERGRDPCSRTGSRPSGGTGSLPHSHSRTTQTDRGAGSGGDVGIEHRQSLIGPKPGKRPAFQVSLFGNRLFVRYRQPVPASFTPMLQRHETL